MPSDSAKSTLNYLFTCLVLTIEQKHVSGHWTRAHSSVGHFQDVGAVSRPYMFFQIVLATVYVWRSKMSCVRVHMLLCLWLMGWHVGGTCNASETKTHGLLCISSTSGHV